MATMTSPATPILQTKILPPAPTPPVGTWRHPRLDEIARRKQAATFDQQKLRQIAWSAAFLASTFVLPPMLPTSVLYDDLSVPSSGTSNRIHSTWIPTPTYVATIPLNLLRAYFVALIVLALAPFWRTPDDISDIPLTPNQRNLLGLGPASAPATPGSTYITPPRFTRTPLTDSSRAAMAGTSPRDRSSASPLGQSGSGSPRPRVASSSPFTGSGSPLVRKAMQGGRRWSASGSPAFGNSLLDDAKVSLSGTPSPSRSTASVHLTNKWLYQKMRES
ncbi:hypothetical protein EJ06DRAFT_489701, partial [Trichodelitschia bisporula]